MCSALGQDVILDLALYKFGIFIYYLFNQDAKYHMKFVVEIFWANQIMCIKVLVNSVSWNRTYNVTLYEI